MNYQKAIDQIIENFDFEKVQKVMGFLNWKWAFPNGTLKIPDIEDLKNTARELLKMAVNDEMEISYVSSGGLKASKFKQKNNNSYRLLQLNFYISESPVLYYNKYEEHNNELDN